MSYARFSSDDFLSDVYVYDDVSGGTTIYVANQKPIIDRSVLGPWIDPRDDVEGYMARHRKLSSLLEDCEYEPLTFANAGEAWFGLSHAEAAQKLFDLEDAGAHIPKHTIQALLDTEDNDG